MILELYVTMLCLGLIIGVIEAWNERVSLFVWLGFVLLLFISLINGGSFNMKADLGISNWHWLGIIASAWFGVWCGKGMYNKTYKKEKKIIT